MTNESSPREKKHQCKECPKGFEQAAELRRHARVHGPKQHECPHCDARFAQLGGLRSHLVSRHNEQLLAEGDTELFICHHCGKSFPLKERLRLHLRVHTGERPYECHLCPKKFARGGQLTQHVHSHTGERPYKCQTCSAAFSCPANLRTHLKRHLGERDHVCEVCGKSFTRRDGLQKHLSCYHRGHRAFRCNVCQKDFKGHLLQHLRTHWREKPYTCNECEASFAQRSQLTVHLRTHSGERPYSCRVCRQAFSHSTALKMHVRRHTGEKPFKCLLCPATSFVQLPHLKKHMLCIHKTDKPYLCLGCKNFFKTKSELEKHQETCISAHAVKKSKSETAETKPRVGMALDRMRLLLAVLLKKISLPTKLEALGFGRRLIDEVLCESIEGSGRKPCREQDLDEQERLKRNVAILFEWTVPKTHMARFRKEHRTTEELLEELAS